MKYTHKDAVNAFTRLAKALGKSDVWTLDKNFYYGGYAIEEAEKNGGVSRPFGLASRMNTEQFCRAVDFALYAVEIKERK